MTYPSAAPASITARPSVRPDSASPFGPHRRQVSLRAGRALAHAGDPVDDVATVVAGLVRVVGRTVDGQERVVAVLGPGDAVGLAAAVRGGRHAADVVALGDVVAALEPAADAVARLHRDPAAALALVGRLDALVSDAWENLTAAYLPVEGRLAAALVRLATRHGEIGRDGRGLLRCGLSHQDFAALVGAQRASVSVAMATFRRAGAAAGARGRYRVDLARLRRFVPDAGGWGDGGVMMGG